MSDKPYSVRDEQWYQAGHAAVLATAQAELKAANDTIASASLALHDAQAELTALRAKWEALRGEVEAWRTWNAAPGYCQRNFIPPLRAARTLTDSTHALEKP